MKGKAVLETLRRTLDFYGPTPPPNEVSEQLGISKEEADALWEDFMESEYGRVLKNDVVKEEAPPPKTKRKYVRKAKPVATTEAPKEDKPKKHIHDLPLEAIKTIAAISALVIAFRMVGYLVEYFSMWETTEWLAWATAVALSLILFISMQAAIMAWKSKQWMLLLTSGLLFVAMAYVDISGTATVIGKKKQAVTVAARTESADVLRARERVPQLNASISSLDKDLAVLRKEREQLVAEQEGLDKADPRYNYNYNSLRNRLATNKTSLDAKQNDRDNKDAERTALQNTPGYYSTAVAELTDGSAEFTDWAVAVGLGLVGPWALSVTLFLRGKDDKNKEAEVK